MKIKGFSLVEMMVGVGIVSVVGVGMYTGFQQLDQAQQAAREIADSTNQKGLLLDLIETEISLAGTSIDGIDTICELNASGSSDWRNSCEGHPTDTNDQSHGISICREANGRLQNTLFYVSGPIPYQQEVHRDLRCGSEKGPFFDVYSVTNKSSGSGDSCDDLLLTLSDLNESNLRSKNLCELELQKVNNGVRISLTTSGRLTGELVGGNSYEFRNQASLSEQTTVFSKDTLLNDPDNYLVSLEQSQFFTDDATSTNIFLNKPAGRPLEINYKILNSDGTVFRDDCSATIPAGQISVSIPSAPCTLASGQTIALLDTPPIFLGDISTFEVLAAASAAETSPKVRLILNERTIGYGQNSIPLYVVADRVIPLASGAVRLRASNTVTSGPTISYGNSIGDGSPGTLRLVNASAALEDDPASFYLNDGRVEFELKAASTAGTITEDQTYQLNLEVASGPIESNWLQVNDTDRLRIVTNPEIPRLSWLQTHALVKEPATGESNRSTVAILLSEPPPTQSTVVTLTPSTASGASCIESDNGEGFSINALPDVTDASCTSLTIEPGQARVAFELAVHPHEGIRSVASGNQIIRLDIASGPSTGALYEVGEDSRLSITVQEEQIPSFRFEDGTAQFAGASTSTSDSDITIDDFLNLNPVPSLRYSKVNESRILLYEESASVTGTSGTIPIQLNDVEIDSGVVYVRIASAASIGGQEDHLNYGTDFGLGTNFSAAPLEFDLSFSSPDDSMVEIPFWVKDDDVEELHERIDLEIYRAIGSGLTRTPEIGSRIQRAKITLVDRDLCAIGAGLTGGSSPTDHFHSRGTTELELGTVMGATVRIGDGSAQPADAFDSANDRLIVTDVDDGDISESGNTISYANVAFTGSGGNWTFDANYLISQGVLEIEVIGTEGVPSLEMIEFLRERVSYQNNGTASGNRNVTFTLGLNVQAWDGHEDGTVHYYRYVPVDSNTTWTAAKDLAANDDNMFFGQRGYLATITSWAENNFLAQRFNNDGGPPGGWLGGRARPSDLDDWIWDTGPEEGIRFWRGHNGAGYPIDGTSDDGEVLTDVSSSRVDQTELWNGSPHIRALDDGTGPRNDNLRRDYGYSRNDQNVPSTLRFANWSASSTNTSMEPNNKNDEQHLQMTGSGVGGGMWNDVRNTQKTTENLNSDGTPYGVDGYYIEYGGPEKSDFEIINLKLSQTSTFSTQTCGVNHGTLPTMCRAWPDLEAGLGSNSSVGDFYSPGTLNSSAEVVDQPRARVNLYIDQENYNSVTDRLVVADTTPSQGANTSILVYGPRSVTTEVTGTAGPFNLTGTFYINQGFLQLSASPSPTGRQWADILNRFVEYQNPGNTTDSDYAIDRSITYTLGDGVAWPYHPDGTTHFYRFVENDSINWTDAQTAAQSNSARYFNENGYLATITSVEEHEFLARSIPRPTNGAPITAWLGGSDADVGGTNTEGVWTWRGGPETGQQFWQGALLPGRPIIAGDGSVETEALPTCTQQVPDRDGSTHNTGDVHVLDMIGNEGAEASPYRFTKWSCAPGNINRPEPSGLVGSSIQEDYLILSATDQGGETWNDTRLDGVSDNSWLDPKGYIAEFGGNNEFFNRSTSQTYRISPEQCFMNEDSGSAACLPGAALSIGNATSPTDANFDFYGSNLLGQTTSRANVKISIETYVNESLTVRDELALRGATGQLSDNSLEKTYMNVPIGFAGISDNIRVSGTWNFSTGVLRLRAINTSTNTETAISAEAWTSFLNQRVQLLFASEGDNTAGNRAIEFTLGDALAWDGHEDGTTHFYRFVAYPDGTANSDKEWTDSRTAATSTAQQYFGVSGYLATITSLQENQFMASGFSDNEGNPAAGWVGGSDVTTEGKWIWVDGPEANRRFHSGRDKSIRDDPDDATDLDGVVDVNTSTNCAVQNSDWHLTNFSDTDPLYTASNQSDRILFWRNFGFPADSSTNSTGKRFSNWSCNGGSIGRQPSNSGSGGQDYLLITGSSRGGGMWNDVGNEGIPGSGDLYTTTGYYVEYGGNGEFSSRKFNATVTVNNTCEVQ